LAALGYRYGNGVPGDFVSKFSLFEKRDEFLRRFAEMNGSVMCSELIGTVIADVRELGEASAAGVFKKCPGICINSLMILEEML